MVALALVCVMDCIMSPANSYVEILISSISENDLFGNRVIADIIKDEVIPESLGP